jgi:hypothetical protein
MTPETLDKLRQAFIIGATKEEACAYAEISKVTLYSYIDKNPDFVNDIEAWQQTPLLKAKATVNKNLDDAKTAQWYLERRAKEFKPKQDLTTNDKDLPTPILNGIEKLNVSTNDSSTEVTEPEQEN